jgi:hypothetical protein
MVGRQEAIFLLIRKSEERGLAAGLAAVDVHHQDMTADCWSAVPVARDPLLEEEPLDIFLVGVNRRR